MLSEVIRTLVQGLIKYASAAFSLSSVFTGSQLWKPTPQRGAVSTKPLCRDGLGQVISGLPGFSWTWGLKLRAQMFNCDLSYPKILFLTLWKDI